MQRPIWNRKVNRWRIAAAHQSDAAGALPFHRYLHRIQRIPQGGGYRIREHVRAIDHMDGDISEKLEFYGQVNPMKKGVYTVRCVVR